MEKWKGKEKTISLLSKENVKVLSSINASFWQQEVGVDNDGVEKMDNLDKYGEERGLISKHSILYDEEGSYV